MPKYLQAIIIEIDAPSYDESLKIAKNIAEGTGENCWAETYFEHDNEGQRVIYLPSEEEN